MTGPEPDAGFDPDAGRGAGSDAGHGAGHGAGSGGGPDAGSGAGRDSGPGSGPGEPTPEQRAERARRADRATRGALAGIAGLEALVVLLVPRAIAQTSTGLDRTTTILLIVLAVLLVATAFVLRRPWGIAVGSILQVPLIATGALTTGMFVIGAIFAGIWLYTLNLRHQLVGTPGGLRMFSS